MKYIIPILILCIWLSECTTAAQRKTLLDKTNYYRAKVASGKQKGQPGASDMLQMTWDSNVEVIAQKWVDQCLFAHNPQLSTLGLGENVFWTSAKRFSDGLLTQAIDLWYNEVSNFDNKTISKYQFKSSTGHYSQLIWGNTYKMACAYKVCSDGTHIVCNYSPPGNYINSKVYTQGIACSTCKNSCDPTYKGKLYQFVLFYLVQALCIKDQSRSTVSTKHTVINIKNSTKP